MPNTEYQNRIFIPKGEFTLVGTRFEFHHSIDAANNGLVVHNSDNTTGDINFRRVTLFNGNLCHLQTSGILYDNCTFFSSSIGQISPGSVVLECVFDGPTQDGHHPHFNTGSSDVATFGCLWRGSSRGMVHQTGSILRNLAIDCSFSGGGHIGNGGEVILFENNFDPPQQPGYMGSSAFLWFFLNDWYGTGLNLTGSGIGDVILWDWKDAGLRGRFIDSNNNNDGQLGRIYVQNAETSGTVFAGPGNTSIGLQNVQWRPGMPSCGNQGSFAGNYAPFAPVTFAPGVDPSVVDILGGCNLIGLDGPTELNGPIQQVVSA